MCFSLLPINKIWSDNKVIKWGSAFNIPSKVQGLVFKSRPKMRAKVISQSFRTFESKVQMEIECAMKTLTG